MKVPAITVNGAYIRALRDAHGHTVNSFATLVRTSASNLSRIESCDRQPAPDLRKRIATELRVPLVALRDREPFEAALTRALEAVAA
jgi:transcriptional regulator with XRE-family HTH domain